MHTILRSASKEVMVGIDRPFIIIGEKINPTGRKKLAAALTEGNFDYASVALRSKGIIHHLPVVPAHSENNNLLRQISARHDGLAW